MATNSSPFIEQLKREARREARRWGPDARLCIICGLLLRRPRKWLCGSPECESTYWVIVGIDRHAAERQVAA